MNNGRVQIWIAVVAGLTSVVLLLVAGSAAAKPSPPLTSATQSYAVGATNIWGSAWVPITRGETITFEHNLGQDPDNYAVELLFRDTDGGRGINRRNYGGLEVNDDWYGAHWQHLTSNTIEAYRQPDDNVADLIRVRVWVPPDTPDSDNGWLTINQGQTITVNHNVGITPTELTVGLWFSGTNLGIHQFASGGLAVDGPQLMWGAHWQNLTTNTVEVVRRRNDQEVEQVRVIVTQGATPAYDSGWQDISLGSAVPFTHGLGWDPNMLLVRAECYDTSGPRGIHQLFAGGNHSWLAGGSFQGGNWENLTSNTIVAVRRIDDEFCPQVRIRIWKQGGLIYLPLVLRNN